MDPLYANYDKRKKTLEENSAPVPQPTPNSMPVFGAAAAPTPTVEPTPVAEPTPAPTPEPTPAPAVEPVAEPVVEPVAAPAQNPFESQQQPVSFEQQFEQMVDGVAPAQLSEPQPQFNPNYTGTGDIILNLDQPKKKFNTKILAIFGGIFVIVIIAVALIALGGNKSGAGENGKQAVNNFIEYFIYGTEGENEVTDESFNGEDGVAFFKKMKNSNLDKNIEYREKITQKISSIKGKPELAEKMEVYMDSSRDIYTDFLTQSYIEDQEYESLEYDGEDENIKNVINSVNKYRKNILEYINKMKENDCIDGMEVDVECRGEYYDENDDDFWEENDDLTKSIQFYNNRVEEEIINDVMELYEKNK